jgi:4-amino-4-deoxy-L-arabinose transferase-like glycosyltransferase
VSTAALTRRHNHGASGGGTPAADGERRFWITLVGIASLGLVVRVCYVLVLKRHVPPSGDAFYYHYQAKLLTQGHGFIDPYNFYGNGQRVQSAAHPPLATLVLAVADELGVRSFLAHKLWLCGVGSGTVVILGLLGRCLAGRRAGYFAAAVAAVYPFLWLNDATVMAETVTAFVVALALLVAYQAWDRPNAARAVGLGAVIGCCALARSEQILLAPLIIAPVFLLNRSIMVRRRLALAVLGAVGTLVVLAPWVGYNLTRFEHPVLLSTNFEPGLAETNCASVYHGALLGYWDVRCVQAVTPPGVTDESVLDVAYRKAGLDYIQRHESRFPVVVAARVGRTWGFFDPLGQIKLDQQLELREFWASLFGLMFLYALLALSADGIAVLHRRHIPLSPLLAPIITVTVSVALVFGETRYRVPADVALVALGAVGLDDLYRRATVPTPRRRTVPAGKQPVPAALVEDGQRGKGTPG